jgi:outer membrane receptor protein involved in Fe transport
VSNAWLLIPVLFLATAASAQQAPLPSPTFNVTVTGVTQLPGIEVPIMAIPAPVQTGTARDIEASGAANVADFLNRRLNGVFVNEIQNNPFQPDVNFRGYTASPLLGTPQGLSVYMDGVRMNQPFGEVVSWDLIPRIAISTVSLMPGSNPLFGLNTLGGAIALETKNGLSTVGTMVQATYGNDIRRAVDIEYGGHTASSAFHWYVAGSLFGEDGWRDDSPTDVRQLFGKVGWQREGRELNLSIAQANNSLTGNGLQDFQLLESAYDSVYTKPDTTDNRSTLVNVTTRIRLDQKTSLQAEGFFRDIRTRTLNGDINEDSLDQNVFAPGENANNTPFPSALCIMNVLNVLAGDEPAEKCNGLINRSETGQQSGGAYGQLTRRDAIGSRQNIFTAGGGFETSGVDFAQSTELGYLNPDRSVTGLGAFGDGVSGGEVDGEPFDTRVDLDSTVTTWSLFAADTLPVGSRVHVSLSGRYNHTSIDNRDRIQPGGGSGSLDGEHQFGRFNPAGGVTIDLPRSVNVYAGYNEGSRAPTSIELGCADPEEPCRLPNAMASDPPLDQVVTRTFETGARGMYQRIAWNAGFFTAANRDDILFVLAEQTGFGYFRNFGKTRRQGFEAGVRGRAGPTTFGLGYTLLDATFESEETVNGESNSSNDRAQDGEPGLEGAIEITPGDRLPLVPKHQFKAFADIGVTSRLALDVNLIAMSGSYARGNENNSHEPDDEFYLGAGSTDGYAIVNLGARYQLTRWLQIIGQINNLFDTEYSTAAQLGPAGFTSSGDFVARPFPPVDDEFPLRHTTFLAPGAPFRAWAGVRVRF